MEAFSQKDDVSVIFGARGFVYFKNRKRMDWWIHIVEGKLVSRNLQKENWEIYHLNPMVSFQESKKENGLYRTLLYTTLSGYRHTAIVNCLVQSG